MRFFYSEDIFKHVKDMPANFLVVQIDLGAFHKTKLQIRALHRQVIIDQIKPHRLIPPATSMLYHTAHNSRAEPLPLVPVMHTKSMHNGSFVRRSLH